MALTKITRGVIKANENYDTHNINSTGIVTAVSANFTGNVSIGGTLTYQDVTNIDSVGIITARAGVKVPDNQKVFLGTGDDLQIYHNGSESIILDAGTGQLNIRTDLLRVNNTNDSETLATFANNGAVSLYYDNSKKFETHSSGVVISGNIQLNDSNKAYFGTSQDLQIYHDGSKSLITDSGTGWLEINANNFKSSKCCCKRNFIVCNRKRISTALLR